MTAINPAQPQQAASRINELEDAVLNIQSLASDSLSQIEAIAKLALLAMQRPDAYWHPENIALAFEVIWGIAQMNQSCIESEADGVGCKYDDKASELRFAARLVAKEI